MKNDEIIRKLNGILDFVNEEEYCENGSSITDEKSCVQLVARAKLPTRYGIFTISSNWIDSVWHLDDRSLPW